VPDPGVDQAGLFTGACNVASVLARAAIYALYRTRDGYYAHEMTIGKTKFRGIEGLETSTK